ncbi:MAG TPA: S8 family serine peptidase [Nitrososphaera sp.]|nr:S8 family serine peptidase [Nitrososphaera sp.]
MFLIVASVASAPAYSFIGSISESGPLTSLLNRSGGELLGSKDIISINGFPVDRNSVRPDFGGFINLGKMEYNGSPSRTLVYGHGNVAALSKNAYVIGFGGGGIGQPLLGVAVSESPLPTNLGFSYSTDSPLQFDQLLPPDNVYDANMTGRLSGSSIIGSDTVVSKHKVNGSGVRVAIVDTGTDFGNPDLMHSLARDENGVPIMLDADGQGIVLANATYIAKIDPVSGKMLDAGYTPKSELPDGMTSWVYLNDTGAVYMRVSHGEIPVYNTLYPFFGPPVVNATATVDWKIGESATDYIRSQSGVYRFGVIYQTQLHFGSITFALVPVLVVDSEKPGVYDTIIPDMYSAWYFFARNDLARVGGDAVEHLFPDPSFDFTDDTPIKIGDGNEFLVYDYDKDGFPDFSAGTAGARVVDVWQVISNKTEPVIGDDTGYGGVVVADLLEPMDPSGEYFGVMYDLQGHGTGTASTVASSGKQLYDIYDNKTGYPLTGIAPGAEIVPVKALWAGNSLYGWIYASGFDLNSTDGRWRFSGDHKADIISNSWGVAPFPLLQYGPGYDIMSVVSSTLAVPGLLADEYPGTIMVNSVGNNGLAYGSTGSPNTSPLAISVGATTNNVHIGYNGFENVTRFGNSKLPYDEISDFSSRGPGVLGDPKPELMAVGSYAFTPAIVNLKNIETAPDDSNSDGAFWLFGGTSMAAPMVAGVAALVIDDMKAQGKEIDPFEVKSVLMSSAKDLNNDPFVQGSGRVDAPAAIDLSRGKNRMISAYTEDTVANVLSAMSGAIYQFNQTLGIIDGAGDLTNKLSDVNFRESRWFAGHVEQGESASTDIIVENPTGSEIRVELASVVEKLVSRHEIHNSTRPLETDPLHNTTEFGYIPNYYNLDEAIGGIPENADLMVARVNFPFESFMNLTEIFGDHLRLASIYGYDWIDSDGDGNVTYTETSMINRGGSWGTVQELRVADPAEKFRNTPLIGVYPVPQIFSFWQGDRGLNSTAMNYTLTIEFYSRQPNPAIQFGQDSVNSDKASLIIDAKDKESVRATLQTGEDMLPGVYFGSIIVKAENSNRQMVMPVSYVVTSKPVQKDVPVVFSPDPDADQSLLGLRPNGYVGGLFDMTSRYAAGDWRSYYFTVDDDTITSMSLKISWPHNSTSINAMAFGPDGRVIASSVPAGVFETFAGWPTNDWLGTTPFSEGGAFYFSQNSGANSTLLFVPVNQTGVYSVLLHNTLFHGNSLYEPVQVEAKFSTILPDNIAPLITVDLPKIVGGIHSKIPVTIVEKNPARWSYAIDAGEPVDPDLVYDESLKDTASFDISFDTAELAEGMHRLRVDSSDLVGHSTSFVSSFELDATPPVVEMFIQPADTGIKNPVQDRVVISKDAVISWNITDKNGVAGRQVLPIASATTVQPGMSSYAVINAISLQEGAYEFSIVARDVPGNSATRTLAVVVDRTAPAVTISTEGGGFNVRGPAKILIGAEDPNLKSTTLVIGDRKSVDITGLAEYELDTTELPDGQYTLKVVAVDEAGNENSAMTGLSVSNVAPQIVSATLLGLAAGGGIASAAWLALTRKRRRLASDAGNQ